MTIEQPGAGEPRRPSGPRDPGDAWVVAPTGEKYWGRFGAAGLLAHDAERGVLLQHRVSWSHFGGTWGLPGGARHEGETARDGAIREATEEAGVPAGAVRSHAMSVLDLGYWSYATLLAEVVEPFEPVISDPESVELAWVPVADVERLPLHPGFEAAWPALRGMLGLQPAVIVDVANVMGAVPDGWWRDRAGAAERLLARLAAVAADGVDGEIVGLPGATWYPSWTAITEGQARSAGDAEGVAVVRATASGDDAVVAETVRLTGLGRRVTVITSDRGLAERVTDAGAGVRGVRTLRDLLPD